MRFSIIIPTYEYKGLAPKLLNQLLTSISEQTFKDYNIVISDHSKSNLIKDYLENEWPNMPIIYHKNERGIGNSSINMNEGIKLAKGDFIKVMHMDDWFCNPHSLNLIDQSISKDNSKKWGGLGFNHYYEERDVIERFITPYIDPNIRTLIGCPSVSFFINDDNFYDENLIIINDSDMHIRLGKKYGNPILINEYCVTVRMSENQVSNQVTEEQHREEIIYYQNKNF